MTNNLLPLISAITALVAVIVSPLISIYISKRQIIAPMKKQWKDDFLDLISEYLSLAQYMSVFFGMPSTWNEEARVQYRRLLHLRAKIEMFLDTNDKAQANLFLQVFDLSNFPISERSDVEKKGNEFNEIRIKVVALAHVIIRRTMKGIF